MRQKFLFLFSLILLLETAHAQKTYLFIGTYTDGNPDKGIYIYQFNTKTGRLKPVSHAENITNHLRQPTAQLHTRPNRRISISCQSIDK